MITDLKYAERIHLAQNDLECYNVLGLFLCLQQCLKGKCVVCGPQHRVSISGHDMCCSFGLRSTFPRSVNHHILFNSFLACYVLFPIIKSNLEGTRFPRECEEAAACYSENEFQERSFNGMDACIQSVCSEGGYFEKSDVCLKTFQCIRKCMCMFILLLK